MTAAGAIQTACFSTTPPTALLELSGVAVSSRTMEGESSTPIAALGDQNAATTYVYQERAASREEISTGSLKHVRLGDQVMLEQTIPALSPIT